MQVAERQPHSLSPRGLAIAGWVALVLAIATFITLAWQVQTLAPIVALDTRISQWLHFNGIPGLTKALLVVTYVHSILGMSIISAAFGVVLWRMRELYWLLTLALAMVGGMLLNVLLKVTYERARPVFEANCARCHTQGGAKTKKKILAHFDMTSYPFGGEHAAEIGEEIREVLAIGGGKPSMPADKKGAVKGDELALIAAWTEAYDAARAGGAHADR